MRVKPPTYYVVGRSKRTDRPVCQHALNTDISVDQAICGYDLLGTSREYTTIRFKTMLCKRCKKIQEGM